MCDINLKSQMSSPIHIQLFFTSGEVVCLVVAYLRNPLAATEILLICLISTHRVWTIRMALRADQYTPLHARVLAAAAWLLPLLIVVLCLCQNTGVEYDPLLSTCKALIVQEENTQMSAVVLIFSLVLLPFCITILGNLCLLYYAIILSRHHQGASYKGALVTVFALCGVFVITGIPNMVRLLLPPFGKSCPRALEIFNTHVYLINSSCDSILFTITSRRFRTFICRRILMFYRVRKKDKYVAHTNSNTRSNNKANLCNVKHVIPVANAPVLEDGVIEAPHVNLNKSL